MLDHLEGRDHTTVLRRNVDLLWCDVSLLHLRVGVLVQYFRRQVLLESLIVYALRVCFLRSLGEHVRKHRLGLDVTVGCVLYGHCFSEVIGLSRSLKLFLPSLN